MPRKTLDYYYPLIKKAIVLDFDFEGEKYEKIGKIGHFVKKYMKKYEELRTTYTKNLDKEMKKLFRDEVDFIPSCDTHEEEDHPKSDMTFLSDHNGCDDIFMND
eukprot:TRINITY_DN63555_c0_g1_i1.p1 TRINITY_DN63555_c0_g1~~TRINITY_DN63555_c0_g1_i1.p1  ORF type:complete len:104 (+),score=0.60 TRINITY_DN63555_c0_g1_i1:250-561(+)